MNTNRTFTIELTSAALHILAMVFMLLDHLWAAFALQDWMTCVGRLAYPIFAFLLVEGFYHTRDRKNYIKRMVIFAVISELPFNLMYSGSLFYPIHQNVLWTFVLALCGLCLMEKARHNYRLPAFFAVCAGVTLLGFVLGFLLFVDYYGCGVVTVFVFYFFYREREENLIAALCKNGPRAKALWTAFCLVGQLLCLYIINVKLLGGLYYPVRILGREFELVQQGLALLALIPIWLYRGRQGYHARWFQYFNYWFYPVHCLLLGLLSL